MITVRELILAPRTWYVNNSSGSDTNDGNKPASAFKTINHAAFYLATNFDFAINCTLQLATTGVVYSEAVVLPRLVGNAYLTIQGDVANNANVAVTSATGAPFTAVNSTGFILDSLLVGTSTAYNIISDAGSHLLVHNMNYAGAGVANIFVEHNGFYEDLTGSYIISGPSMWHIATAAGGHYVDQGNYCTFANSPAFSHAFGLVSIGSFLDCRLLLGWAGTYTSSNIHNVDNDGTAANVALKPNVGYWP